MDDLIPNKTKVYIYQGIHKGQTFTYPGGSTLYISIDWEHTYGCCATYKLYWSKRFKQWRARPTDER